MSIPLHSLPKFEAGDPKRFAFLLQFSQNLDPNYATPEEDISWGRFQLWVDGINLCQHVDHGEVRQSVDWYLLPLLEWLAQTWDSLLHEQRLPGGNCGDTAWESLRKTRAPQNLMRPDEWDSHAAQVQYEWASRHCIRTARHGGLFPDVVLRRNLDEIEISWGQAPLAGAPKAVQFIATNGAAHIAPNEVADVLYRVLEQATQALCDSLPSSSRLNELKDTITKLQCPSRVSARVSLLAGLGSATTTTEAAWSNLIAALTSTAGHTTKALKGWFTPESINPLVVYGTAEAAVMFGAASPTLKESDVLTIATKLLAASQSTTAPIGALSTSDHSVLDSSMEPWEEGYELAGDYHLKHEIPRKPNGAVDIEAHLNILGVTIESIELADSKTAGLAVVPTKGRPTVFINKIHNKCRWPSGRRFVIAHEFCHILNDKAKGRNLALISGPWAPRNIEKRANAFAAALLMPPKEIASRWRIAAHSESFPALLDLAKKYEVSPDALGHHLKNCGLIDEETEEDLLAQLSNRSETDSDQVLAPKPPRKHSRR